MKAKKERSEKQVYECFGNPRYYAQRAEGHTAPSCVNSNVRYRRYRITVELIDESVEVLKARLQKMWDECKNPHRWAALRMAAKAIGLELKHKCSED